MLGFRVWDKKLNTMYRTEHKYLEFNIYLDGRWEVSEDSEGVLYLVQPQDRFVFMQSTGFKDLRGVEIFEGDVIYVSSNIPEINNYYYLVKSVKDFLLHRGSFRNSLFRFLIDDNIYQQPELLERLK